MAHRPRLVPLLVVGAAGALAVAHRADRALRRRFGVPPRRRAGEPPEDGVVDVALAGANGLTLRGWLVPAGTDPGPAVVVLHGWGASATDMLPAARWLAAAGLHALVVDARCHGRSDQDEFASMPRFAEDAEAAIRWLRRHPLVDPERIALLGHSVGAGACLFAASRDPRVAGVVSVSSLAHPGVFMRSALVRQGVPGLIARAGLRYVERVIGHRYDEFAPVRTISRVSVPVLLVHGDDDRTVPLADARELHAAAAGRARLVVVPGAGHTDLEALRSVTGEVVDFLREVTRPAAPGDPRRSAAGGRQDPALHGHGHRAGTVVDAELGEAP